MSFSLDLPTGVVKSTTPNTVGKRWIDTEATRFLAGRPQKIGGWVKYIDDQTLGKVRGLFGWISEAGSRLASAGTYIKLYTITDHLIDITPWEATGTLTDPFTTISASAVVKVTDTAHGLDVGAFVNFSGASAVGGITIDGAYQVTAVNTVDEYTITHSAAASSSAGPGGGTVTYGYEINPGGENGTIGLGYGAGPYGAGTYGTPRVSSSIENEARVWSLAKYGDFLLALPSGGHLYYWDEPSSADRAELVTNSPTARYMFVTAEGYPTLLGTDTPMTMAWPDIDDITDWTPSDINTADIRTESVGNRFIAGTALTDVNLLWTDISIFVHQFTGDAFVYSTRLAATNAGLLGPLAFAVYGKPATAIWMTQSEFLMYDGSVRGVPRQAEIREYVFGRLDRDNAAKTWGFYNQRFNEVWFGYVSTDSPDGEPDSYAMVSIEDGAWSVGSLARTGAATIPSAKGTIIMTGTDRYIYEHEVGADADGAPLPWRLGSGTMTMNAGDTDTEISRYIHDTERQTGPVGVRLRTKERPKSSTFLEDRTFTLTETDVEADMMMAGRHVDIEYSSNEIGADIRLGTSLLTIGPAGMR